MLKCVIEPMGVSIPYGTIKSVFAVSALVFIVVSIPYGTIKRKFKNTEK